MSAATSLELAGELTIQTAAERKATLVEALDSADTAGAGGLDLDLAGVTELDTAGLQLLLMLQKEGAHRGLPVKLTAMSQTVIDVLSIAHLDGALDPRLAAGAGHPSTYAEESKP